ncbi:MAG: DUF58 domain-containing protein [Haloarculaceae archaeon]
MDVTRRFWTAAVAGALLAALGAAFARPVLLVGAAAVGALLVGRAYGFVRALAALDRSLTVETAVGATRTQRDDATDVTLAVAVEADGGTPLPLAVTAGLPVIAGAVDEAARTVHLEPGESDAATAFSVEWPAVGRATVPPATVRATDAFGLFAETFERGPERTVTVDPREPGSVHVGEGGDPASATFGGHRTGQYGQGTDPAEVRQYVPGDSVSDIDWKATARMAYPHVREYEVESDRRTAVLFDHRARTATGSDGERKLDYLREVALTVVVAAEAASDPLAAYAVGDGGLTAERSPSTAGRHYRSVRSLLHDLEPTGEGRTRPGAARGVGAARRSAAALGGDDSAFAATLAPYLADTAEYVQRMDEDPLFETARTRLGRLRGTQWVLLFTDDTDRERVRETVRLVRDAGNDVVVFLAPSVLFEPGGLADLDAAYERYADFESFRRDLARLDRVTAYEVGPGDRVDAVLSASDRRRG